MDRSQQRLQQLVQVLHYREEYWTEVTRIREKWRLPEGGYPRWTDRKRIDHDSMDARNVWAAQWEAEGVQDPYMAIYEEVTQLNRRFGLPQELDRLISNEILYGETEAVSGIAVATGFDPDGLPYAVVYISPDLTVQMLQDNWEQVRQAQEWLREQDETKVLPPQRVKRNLDRDLFIWKRTRRDGLSLDDAYDEWLDDHPDELEEPVNTETVRQAVNRLEKEYGLR